MKEKKLFDFAILFVLLLLIISAIFLSRHQITAAEEQVYRTSLERVRDLKFNTNIKVTMAEIKNDLTAWRMGGHINAALAPTLPPHVLDANRPAAWKANFIHTILPITDRANSFILDDRRHLQSLQMNKARGRPLSRTQVDWLNRITKLYRLNNVDISRLQNRIDSIPNSLVLAQAAIESGWGRSRFARHGNALFGQWTWGQDGIIPEGRPFGARYRVKSFENLALSIHSYMRNINTHRAYKDFRKTRQKMRMAGQRLDVEALSWELTHYSERGAAYSRDILKTIRANSLTDFDRSQQDDD
ncbi:MAG: glucosaminidase domain-containing protein [Sphingomonadales bacterium]